MNTGIEQQIKWNYLVAEWIRTLHNKVWDIHADIEWSNMDNNEKVWCAIAVEIQQNTTDQNDKNEPEWCRTNCCNTTKVAWLLIASLCLAF